MYPILSARRSLSLLSSDCLTCERVVARTHQTQQACEYEGYSQESAPGPWPLRTDIQNLVWDPARNTNHKRGQREDSGRTRANPGHAVLFELNGADGIHAFDCGGNLRAGESYASPSTSCSADEMSLIVMEFIREFT